MTQKAKCMGWLKIGSQTGSHHPKNQYSLMIPVCYKQKIAFFPKRTTDFYPPYRVKNRLSLMIPVSYKQFRGDYQSDYRAKRYFYGCIV